MGGPKKSLNRAHATCLARWGSIEGFDDVDVKFLDGFFAARAQGQDNVMVPGLGGVRGPAQAVLIQGQTLRCNVPASVTLIL